MSEERKKLANKIRTSLLIIIYDELNKMKNSNKNILLINSEESKEYEKKFDKFVIIERESHMSSNKNLFENISFTNFFNPPNDFQKEKTFISQKIQISKRRNAIFKVRKKKNFDFNTRKEYEFKQKLIDESVRALRFFCFHLKSKDELNNKNNQRNKSAILRRKKFSHIINQKSIFTLRQNNILKRESKEIDKDSESIIILHKMWNSKKKKINNKKKYYFNNSPKKCNYTTREKLLFNE